MGQTLTHGIYLPDEGERNCYNGLAANWQLLDGAVGTVASHTTALAGKAPLVHTHTKSAITDFPAYGNAAGTICEGNDSRLSDARTPVAHTHTKSDVTDLLNSNFIPSANNSYDLGSSSNQWNNLYAKNYYYNGTQWGLDQANEWTGQNTFTAPVAYTGNFAFYWRKPNLTVGTLPSSIIYYGVNRYADSAGTTIVLQRGVIDTSGKNAYRRYTYAFSDTSKYCSMGSGINADGSGSYYAFNAESVIPGDNNTTDLGTSTNKWKTLNGINPGALSLPDWLSDDYMDVAPSITKLNGDRNTYVAPFDGWLVIAIATNTSSDSYISILTNPTAGIGTRVQGTSQYNSTTVHAYFPFRQGKYAYIYVLTSELVRARFYPCLGNV